MDKQLQTALALTGLVKRYGAREALAGLDLTVAAGRWVALLGPNGAGKSTLFQVLTGLFAPDEGQISVAGHDMTREPVAALRHIGVVFQQMSLDLDLSVERNLRFHADLHGLPRRVATARIDEHCRQLGVTDNLPRRVRELSGGNRRKVELVRALLHAPQVLLLDEPTVGLDPQSRRDLMSAVRAQVQERRLTVLWATHLVAEAEAADRVLVLHQGRALADGSPQAVAQALGADDLETAFIQSTGGRR